MYNLRDNTSLIVADSIAADELHFALLQTILQLPDARFRDCQKFL
jgi:hypothetical protein